MQQPVEKTVSYRGTRPPSCGGRCTAERLSPVVIRVAGQRAFDVVPAVAHRALGFGPAESRVGLGRIPVALELRLDVVEALAAVLAVGVVTVLVGRLVIGPGTFGRVIRRAAI